MERITVDNLYDERGEVTWSRPIIQGDIFANIIILPGFGDEPRIVQVVGGRDRSQRRWLGGQMSLAAAALAGHPSEMRDP